MKASYATTITLGVGAALMVVSSTMTNLMPQVQATSSRATQGIGVRPPDGEIVLVNQIGGSIQAVDIKDDYAYVGVGSRLVILDVHDTSHLVRMGRTDVLAGYVDDIVVDGDYVYLAVGDAGLRIINATDPAAPIEVGIYDPLDPTSYLEPTGMAVAGNYIYLPYGYQGFRIVDISDPTQPTEVIHYPTEGFVASIAVVGNYAYMADCHMGLLIFDVSDPTNPDLISQANVPGYAMDIVVTVSGTIYVASGTFLTIFDGRNPAQPHEIDAIELECTEAEAMGKLVICGSRQPQRLRILKFTNRTKPVEISYYNTPEPVFDLKVREDHVYIANGAAGLLSLSLADPVNPFEVFHYQPPVDVTYDVQYADGYLYISNHHTGLSIFDVSNPMAPQLVRVHELPDAPWQVAIADGYAYVANGDAGLRIIDISTPSTSIEVGICETPDDAFGVVVEGNYAYVADWKSGLRIIDVSEPTLPTEIGIFPVVGGVYTVNVAGDYAYVSSWDAALRVINIRDPGHPRQVSSWRARGGHAVAVAGNVAYVLSSSDYLRAFDISDPANPMPIGSYGPFGPTWLVEAEGEVVIANATRAGVSLLDVGDPSHIRELGVYDTPGNARASALHGEYLYVADYYGGLVVLERKHQQPTLTPTPISTPDAPWARWRDVDPILVPPLGADMVLNYGNLVSPCPMTASIQGPVEFLDGTQMITDMLTTDGTRSFSLYPVPLSKRGQAFTLSVILPNMTLLRHGVVAYPTYLPILLQTQITASLTMTKGWEVVDDASYERQPSRSSIEPK